MPLYELKKMEGKGIAMFATTDMLPGKIFMVDRPILKIDQDEVAKFDELGDISLLVAGYDACRELEEENPLDFRTLLSLFGPTSGPKCEILR